MDPISLVAVGGGVGLIVLLRRNKQRKIAIRAKREAQERAAKRHAKRKADRDWTRAEARDVHDSGYGRVSAMAMSGIEVKEMGNPFDPRYRGNLSHEETRVMDVLLNGADLTKVEVDEINYDFTRTGSFRL